MQGVLTAPDAYAAAATPFVASPGSYMLNLRAGGFNGCSGQSLMDSIGLSYILLGTS